MTHDDDKQDTLPIEITRKIRLISTVAALVLMAGLGTLTAIVIMKVTGQPEKVTIEQLNDRKTVTLPLSVKGKIISASATLDRLTVVSEDNGAHHVQVFNMETGATVATYTLRQP